MLYMETVMKLFLSLFLALLTILLLCTSCGGIEVQIGLGNGNVPDDAVTVSFTLPEKLRDGATISCRFAAEKAADLEGRFLFALALSNPLFSDTYTETVLCSFSGADLAAKKRSDGSCGDLNMDVTFGTLSDLLAPESGTFWLVLHREGAERTDITAWSSGSYGYTRKGGTVQITID